ncbi:MAG: hypothetical protein GXO83_11700, partial [Chlorobi bacterium]|nr:hypothetical protein [Chlorobiota bacterium]
MTTKKKVKTVRFIFIIILLVIMRYRGVAEGSPVIQTLYPHPVIELNKWLVHTGDLTTDKVFENNPNLWQTETLNHEWWEKGLVKWFKREVVIPDKFAGKDVILYIHVSPSGKVFVNGKELFLADEKHGRGVLALSAKAGSKFEVAVRAQNSGYNCRFYRADLVGMPPGYGNLVQTLQKYAAMSPGNGLAINQWKWKKNASDAA